MLRFTQVCAGYGDARILSDLSFSVGAGEAVALIGRNGAGKTTTLKTAIGLTHLFSGDITFYDQSVIRLSPHAIARSGLGWVPEDRRIFTSLTVWENLDVARQDPRPDTPVWDEARILDVLPHLKPLLNRPAGRLSGGEQQMLTIARTLMGQPRLLLLDEPSEGIAPKIVDDLSHALCDIKQSGIGILLSEQNWPFAAAISDRAILLERGSICGGGALTDLTAHPEHLTACLAL